MREVLYDDPLHDMVASGAVTPHSARLWVRSGRPGRLAVRWWREADPTSLAETTIEVDEGGPTDQTASLLLPGDGTALRSLCRYRFRVVHEGTGHVVGEGAFETAPATPAETPRRFALAVWSCHQPFDHRGAVSDEARSMLRAAHKCLIENEVRMLFMVGDQMYSDYPPGFSLFEEPWFRQVGPPGRASINDCTVEEVRRLYHARYRAFWGQDEWKAIQAAVPTYPILDDHDIVDNWGSVPEHGEPRWAAVSEGARRAYLDYQGGRIFGSPEGPLQESFHYPVVYGNCAIFVMDLRSCRMAWDGQRLYGATQEADLRDFLARHADKGALFIVLSVPVAHVPRAMASVLSHLSKETEDFTDRWSAPEHVHDRDHLLAILHDHQREHPAQRLVLLSGDIHLACAHELRWDRTLPPLYQLVSSPITHATPLQVRAGAKALILANRRMTTDDGALSMDLRLLPKTGPHMHNPYAKQNLALVEVETPSPGAPPVLRFCLYGHRDGEPVCVYRSPPIRSGAS